MQFGLNLLGPSCKINVHGHGTVAISMQFYITMQNFQVTSKQSFSGHFSYLDKYHFFVQLFHFLRLLHQVFVKIALVPDGFSYFLLGWCQKFQGGGGGEQVRQYKASTNPSEVYTLGVDCVAARAVSLIDKPLCHNTINLSCKCNALQYTRFHTAAQSESPLVHVRRCKMIIYESTCIIHVYLCCRGGGGANYIITRA